MFNKMKYFFLYCYEAAEKMEERTDSFSEQRAERMETFRTNRQAAEDKAKARMNEMRTEAQKQVKDALGKVGLANSDEISELKTLVSNLTKKVDKLAKK
ncbi:MAG TPA: hypothetical protein ENI11_06615 [Actinobacteria bacterium]|nr:hypothetical protein [Actinomycetota bacterium]